jgi:hypothetical protein
MFKSQSPPNNGQNNIKWTTYVILQKVEKVILPQI